MSFSESTSIAREIVTALLQHGVRHVVLAPGSRSTPLAILLAVLEQRGRIRLHVRIDERGAGFLALGLAQATHTPVPVVCTSGTAVLNLIPSAAEAAYTSTPVWYLTADRPPEQQQRGSSQTIRQDEAFSPYARAFMVSAPATTAQELGEFFTFAPPGPVHLNAPFREPLVPERDAAYDQLVQELCDIQPPPPQPRPAVERPAWEQFQAQLPQGLDLTRAVVVLGPGATQQQYAHARELAHAHGWPVVSEPLPHALPEQPAPVLPVPALTLLAAEAAGFVPAPLVLCVGRVGLTRPMTRLLSQADVQVSVGPADTFEPFGPLGATGREPLHISAVPQPAAPQPAHNPHWLARWQQCARQAHTVVTHRHQGHNAERLSGLDVAELVGEHLPASWQLFAAASRPIRDADLAVAHHHRGLRSNRGVAGIDGLISTAWGLAQAGPVCAMVGDLAFLHDVNALVGNASEPEPHLVFVVVDNNGGGIFHSLEQGAPVYEDIFERVYGTAHHTDLAAITRGFQVSAHQVQHAAELTHALAMAIAEPRVHVIVVAASDRISEAAQHQALREQAVAVGQRLLAEDGR